MYNHTAWPWWDALLLGQITEIPFFEFDPGTKYKTRPARERYRRLHLRDPGMAGSEEGKAASRDQLDAITKDIEFGLTSGYFDGSFTIKRAMRWNCGVTSSEGVYSKARVDLSIEILEPLLRDDTTMAETMANRWIVVVTLLHETAVCPVLLLTVDWWGFAAEDTVACHMASEGQDPGRKSEET